MRWLDQYNKRIMGFALGSLGLWLVAIGCASKPPERATAVVTDGRDIVRIEPDPAPGPNSRPAQLTLEEIRTILRGVRAWERRNWFHRLVMGEANATRAFRDDELEFLAPALSKALAQAGPLERVFFHLSHPTESGDEETTTGWLKIQEPTLHLILSEVHDRHGPRPDISKYDRQMPDVPELPREFEVTFEPEEYLVKRVSSSTWFAPEQREVLQIDYRKALGR